MNPPVLTPGPYVQEPRVRGPPRLPLTLPCPLLFRDDVLLMFGPSMPLPLPILGPIISGIELGGNICGPGTWGGGGGGPIGAPG